MNSRWKLICCHWIDALITSILAALIVQITSILFNPIYQKIVEIISSIYLLPSLLIIIIFFIIFHNRYQLVNTFADIMKNSRDYQAKQLDNDLA